MWGKLLVSSVDAFKAGLGCVWILRISVVG